MTLLRIVVFIVITGLLIFAAWRNADAALQTSVATLMDLGLTHTTDQGP